MIFDLDVETPDAGRIWINIVSRHPHCHGTIRAVFDTGSPRTILSARDVLRLLIPLHSLEQGEPIKGFGRGGIPSKKIKEFTFALRSQDNLIVQIKMPIHVADIATLQKMPQEYYQHALQIPTIIGMDFLKQAGLKTTIDIKNCKAYFEKE